ncbi:hypothetical protein AAFC00_005733 [Neodothiora populina]|uniref:Major facilitator superfamily (MFS) profile domain-containing protein n=1 Tax=Neodothiora populina TaxID=2781224 RepID=A0ABR3P5N5_9PEZI
MTTTSSMSSAHKVQVPEVAHTLPESLYTQEQQQHSSTGFEQHQGEDAKLPASEAFNPGLRFYLAFVSLCVMILMAALDATSLSVALSDMASALHGTAIEAFWAGTSFLLTSTVFQPVIGSFSSIFGRKLLIFISLAFFGVGAIVAAVAKDGDGMAMVLIGRSIQGIGGGGAIVLAEILTTDLVPLRVRGNYQSMIGMMWALGSVGGPLIGGVFAEKVTWRWIFWINLPFIGVGGVMIALFLNLAPLSGSLKAKLARIDLVGCVLFVGSTVGFLIPLTWGGVMYPWSSWRTLVPLLVSLAGLVAFIVWEEYYAKEPMIPFRVMKNRTAAINYLGTFLHGLILWCQLYYMPLYYEAVKHYTPIVSGVALFPMTFTVAPAAIAVGILVTVTGRYRWAIWIGWFLTTLGCGIQILLDVTTSLPAWIFLTLVSGLGTGMLFPSTMFGVQAATPGKDIPSAVALFTFFRSFGQAVGVAIGGVIFQNQIKKQILSHPLIAAHANEWAADSSALVQVIKNMPPGLERALLVQSYADALKIVWAVICGLAFLGLCTSLFTRHFSLDRPLETDQGFVDGGGSGAAQRKASDEDVEKR